MAVSDETIIPSEETPTVSVKSDTIQEMYTFIPLTEEQSRQQHQSLLDLITILKPVILDDKEDVEMDGMEKELNWHMLVERVKDGYYDTQMTKFEADLNGIYMRKLKQLEQKQQEEVDVTKEIKFILAQRALARKLIQQITLPCWQPRTSQDTTSESGIKRERDQDQEDVELRPVKVALFQRSVDAFLFSSPRLVLNEEARRKDSGAPVVGEVREMTILPTPSLSQVPTLGEAVGPAPITTAPGYASTYHRREWSTRRVQPVTFLDYGPFASFAPGYDVNLATLSPSDSMRIAQLKETETQRQSSTSTTQETTQAAKATTTTPPTDIDRELFRRIDVDIDAILNQLPKEKDQTTQINDLLWRNVDLLMTLHQLQDERFSGDKDPKVISEFERQLAEQLKKNLAQLMNYVSPAALGLSKEAIHTAMDQLPYYTPVYRGTLPPSRPFAYASNHCARMAHPLTATVVPGTRGGDAAAMTRAMLPTMTPQPTGALHPNAAAMMARTAPPHPMALRQYQLQLMQQQQQAAIAAMQNTTTTTSSSSVCSNCGAPESTQWRATSNVGPNVPPLCNACGLYFAKHQTHRPVERWTGRAQ